MAVSESRDPAGFGLTVNSREDGTSVAAYIRISGNQVARTEELIQSVLLVDFDHDGNLVGIEILAPVEISQVIEIADRLEAKQREAFQKFVRSSAPPGLVLAS